MTISVESAACIETDAAALQRKEFLRCGLSYKRFSDEFSRVLALAKRDRTKLAAAGFDTAHIAYAEALLETLYLAQADGIVARGTEPPVKREFKQEIARTRADLSLLRAAARCILARTKEETLQKAYAETGRKKGYRYLLNDIFTLIALIRRGAPSNPALCEAGVPLDESRLKAIENRAVHTVCLLAAVQHVENSVQQAADRKLRLLTLAIRTVREIKRYAQAAFYDDKQQYLRDYGGAAQV